VQQPNLIERLENLIASIEQAQDSVGTELDNHLDNAFGIAGECLTMIDGR